jgi:uncharacterized protein YqeY
MTLLPAIRLDLDPAGSYNRERWSRTRLVHDQLALGRRSTMGLREQLMDDLKDAMRRQDNTRKQAIRSVLAAMKQAETELDSSGQRVSLDDDDILAVIAKLAKQRQESIMEFRRGEREDLVAEEQADLEVLQSYLPQQMGRDEIEAEARQVIAETGASGPRDIGKVMKPLMVRLRGRADGKVANQIVRELLAE